MMRVVVNALNEGMFKTKVDQNRQSLIYISLCQFNIISQVFLMFYNFFEMTGVSFTVFPMFLCAQPGGRWVPMSACLQITNF